jgi:hypothetical protein
MITYGVESGSERVRREIMDRQVTNQRFKDVFQWTRDAGILLTCNFMLGLPGETRDDLQQTLDLAEELGVHDFGYFVFYPYPGTALFKVCQERGYLPPDYLTRPANHRQSILTLPGLSQDDIGAYFDRFTAPPDVPGAHRHAPARRAARRVRSRRSPGRDRVSGGAAATPGAACGPAARGAAGSASSSGR